MVGTKLYILPLPTAGDRHQLATLIRNPLLQAIDTTINIYIESVQGLQPSLALPPGTAAAAKVAAALSTASSSSSGGAAKGSGTTPGTPALPSLTPGALVGGPAGGGLAGTTSGMLDSTEEGSSGDDEDTAFPAVGAGRTPPGSPSSSSSSSPSRPSVLSQQQQQQGKERRIAVVATNLDTKLQRSTRQRPLAAGKFVVVQVRYICSTCAVQVCC